MDLAGKRRSTNVVDITGYVADPRGPTSTLSPELMQLAMMNMANAPSPYVAGNDPSSSLAGYARMFAHGSLPPAVVQAFRSLLGNSTLGRSPAKRHLEYGIDQGAVPADRDMYAVFMNDIMMGQNPLALSLAAAVDPRVAQSGGMETTLPRIKLPMASR